ncbi:hypothetical protein J4Q44_G00143590 [Coregonus suidteri]|uniref:Uncharacterized protein n=1 Tax=Coregonus suidteri TaxID=861788 RepID=A0AAN8LYG6_9TELE
MEETGEAQVQSSIPETQNDRPKRKANKKRKFNIDDDETSPESNNNTNSRPGLRRGSSFTFQHPWTSVGLQSEAEAQREGCL